ncbi:hypothetical protein BGX33_007599 [Mortierella sp. NVP41]|nr:hypothetical protein BGX33_007599 [Mortierella sp. NVP41]
MATVFQLARVKRAVPCSSGSSQWTLDVPELTKTLLEDITHPLVVVSYFSHDQEVRDTLWTVFKELYGGIQQKRQSTGILPTGVWGWFTGTEATTSRDETRSTMTVQTLHLVYGGDEELTGQWQEEDDVGRRVEDLLCSLMVLCSTYMTVVSAGLETTQSELEKLVGSLRTLHGDGKQNGRATLESVMDSAEDEKNDDDDRPRKIRKGLLDSVCRAFDGIECSRAPLLVSGRSRRNSEVVAFGTETGAGTFRILCDYSIEDNKAEKMSQWIRMLWKSFDTVDRVDVDSDYPNLISALLKNRLPGARASSAGGVDAGAGSAAKVSSFSVANSALSNVAPKIKDYKDLLLAVDQVRRGYLDRCIPSPEAVSVLDNLDDMQRSESVLFLQILAAVAASTTNANTTAASSMSSATTTNTQQQQQQAATKRGTPSKRYSITNHPTVALNGRELMIHPAVGDDTRIMTGNSMGGSSSRMSNGGGRSSSSQAIDQQQAPTELELQIADILQSKRRTAQEEFAFESRCVSYVYSMDLK